MCEHNLRKIRNGDNMKLFKPAHNKQTRPMHTITNVLNLANIHTGKYIRQYVKAGLRTVQDLDDEEKEEVRNGYIEWESEYDADSNHQWWYNRYTVYLLNVANGAQAALRKAYDTKTRIRHLRKEMQAIAFDIELPDVSFADRKKVPPTSEQVLSRMQSVTDKYADTKDWNWLRPHKRPRKWPGDEAWNQMFGGLGCS